MVGFGVGLENRRTNGKNEVLPENHATNVRSEVSQQTYDTKPRRMIVPKIILEIARIVL